MSNTKHVSHIKSHVTISGSPKLPTIDDLVLGELAVNYADSAETISLKNDANEIVTFSSDEIVKSWVSGGSRANLNGKDVVYPKFYAPVKKGTSGYTLISDKFGVPQWEKDIEVILNGSGKTDYNYKFDFYAPTSAGTSGYTLVADKNGIPVWTSGATAKVNMNGEDIIYPHFYAPISAGTSGYTLVADKDGVPVWTSGTSRVNLNSKDTTYAKFYAPVSGGTKDYTLIADENGIPVWVKDINVILNGKDKTFYNNNFYFYAPTSAGTSGYTLEADENGIPVWVSGATAKVNMNGKDVVYPHFYAPISAGTSGYTLVADKDGIPVWTSGTSRVNLNGVDTTYAKFYAPISGGTSGQTLEADKNGIPVWVDSKLFRTINSSAITGDTKDLLVVDKVKLNGVEKTSGITFYAPISAGTSGYVITADKDGIPVWSSGATSKVNLNGKDESYAKFYAPVSAGTKDYTLVADENGIPQWEKDIEVILNGSGKTDYNNIFNFYAPTSAGTSGYVITADKDGLPVWSSGATSKVNLNGKDDTYAKFYAPVSGGTSGQTLKASGDGIAPFWKDEIEVISLTRAEYDALSDAEKHDMLKLYVITDGTDSGNTFELYLNGKINAHPYFYAPTTSGISGYTLVADENGIPTWVSGSSASVNLNGKDVTDAKFYAPISAGTSGYTLVADKDGIPVWSSGATSKVNLNGKDDTYAKFYAPISGGTSGQTLKASGDGLAPFWKDEIEVISLTKAEYDALSDAEKHDTLKVYLITDDNTESGNTFELYLNGKINSHPYFYAPTTSGTSGYTLVADENGIPQWEKDIEVILNGSGKTEYNNVFKIYAPTTSGTSGYTLQANADGIPVWVSGSSASVNLNGKDVTDAKFYAPLSGGASGYVLTSNGDGIAPEWENPFSAYTPMSAFTSAEKTTAEALSELHLTKQEMLIAGSGINISDDNVISANASTKIKLNGIETEDADFYAPINAGISGQTLVADVNGIPVWEDTKLFKTINSSAITGDTTNLEVVDKVNINGEDKISGITFYAPISGGTSGQVLTSKGTDAPEWEYLIKTIELTKAEYDALTEDEKNNPLYLYVVTDDNEVSYPLQEIYDMQYPVNSTIVAVETPVVPAEITATWEDVTSDYTVTGSLKVYKRIS